MRVSIVFMTGREDHHLDWALDSLSSQVERGDEIDLIIVDTRGRELVERERVIIDRIWTRGAKLMHRVTRPKPNVWQGKYRVTQADWWATANARNTALCLARFDYIAFLDDRCRLGPLWLETVRKAERARVSVLAGSYDKLEGIEGSADNPRRTTRDHRGKLFPSGKINCGGGWLYGCTIALPLAWALDVNGLEEGCDGLTGEDYIFGLMLGNAGHRIDFVPSLFVHQDRTPGNESCKGSYRCADKGVSPNDKSHAALKRFGTRTRTEFTPDLRKIREDLAMLDDNQGLAMMTEAGGFPVPDGAVEYRDWYDGQLIREMV